MAACTPTTLAVVGTQAPGDLDHDDVAVAFIGTRGVSVERGLTTSDAEEAAATRALIGAARRTVLLADHSKVGHDDAVWFADLEQIDTFICDAGLDREAHGAAADRLSAAGARMIGVTADAARNIPCAGRIADYRPSDAVTGGRHRGHRACRFRSRPTAAGRTMRPPCQVT